MNKPIAYKAERIFTGTEMLRHQAIIVQDETINQVVAASSLTTDIEIKDFENSLLAPAFIDLQIYGAHKRLLAAYPDAKTVEAIYDYSKSAGTAWCMPTVATNTYEVIFRCIDAIKEYIAKGGKGILGLHVEGPWISKEKRGAHNPEWISVPSIEKAKALLEYGKGIIKMITLAPEVCDEEVIKLIQSYNIIVSAGHSNATYQEAITAFNNEIFVATHLYNAMSPLHHREPGMVGAIFSNPTVYCSIVPDGHHVDYSAISIAKKIMGERLFAITDAVTETNHGYYRHYFEEDKYTCNGILSGSALTMHKAFKNLVHHCNTELEEALRMCSLYPASVLNIQHKMGMIKENYRAEMIVLNNELQLIQTINF
ncbi:MAG: N-acetylglucosamine-6-phosphate deacetylase [Parafilimonas sp.]